MRINALGLVVVMVFGGTAGLVEAADKPFAVTPDGISFSKPDTGTATTLLPSAVPGTFLIRHRVTVPGDPAQSSLCYYLVKGYADKNRELTEALVPENVMQMSCERVIPAR